jgi:alkanesulfonate monooxygenase SsuD/methylene tetrahydromethanopterin reductase-like flavin-dependent oxidoreductase (luciferase family)
MVIVPFFEAAPVRLAEELAVLDLTSGGRINPVIIAGYGPNEFEMYGVDPADRPRLMEEMVAFCRQAWTGEPFEYQGRHFQVTPRPLRDPGPNLVLGGATPAGARRAARIGDEFQAAGPGLWHTYADECKKLGRETGDRWIAGPAFLYIAEDPERAWQQVGPYVAHHADSYAGLTKSVGGENGGIFPPATDIEGLKKRPDYQVVTPDQAVALAERYDPAGALLFTPQMAGLPPDLSWPSLELFEASVLPRINVVRPDPPVGAGPARS